MWRISVRKWQNFSVKVQKYSHSFAVLTLDFKNCDSRYKVFGAKTYLNRMTLTRWTVNQNLHLRHVLYSLLLRLWPPPSNLQFSKIHHILLIFPCWLHLISHCLPPIFRIRPFLILHISWFQIHTITSFFDRQCSWSWSQFASINIRKSAPIISRRLDWKNVRDDDSDEGRIQLQKTYLR